MTPMLKRNHLTRRLSINYPKQSARHRAMTQVVPDTLRKNVSLTISGRSAGLRDSYCNFNHPSRGTPAAVALYLAFPAARHLYCCCCTQQPADTVGLPHRSLRCSAVSPSLSFAGASPLRFAARSRSLSRWLPRVIVVPVGMRVRPGCCCACCALPQGLAGSGARASLTALAPRILWDEQAAIEGHSAL